MHIEDCDVRLNGGRGFMREAAYLLIKELFPEKKLNALTYPTQSTIRFMIITNIWAETNWSNRTGIMTKRNL